MKKVLLASFIIALVTFISTNAISISKEIHEVEKTANTRINSYEVKSYDSFKEIICYIFLGGDSGEVYAYSLGILGVEFIAYNDEVINIKGYRRPLIYPEYFSVSSHHVIAPFCYVYDSFWTPWYEEYWAVAIGNIYYE